MKKIIITAIVCIVLGLGAGWLLFHPSTNKGVSGERKILYYRDPMNPEMTSPTPRKAPDGMDYVPVYADEATAPVKGIKIDPVMVQDIGVKTEEVKRRHLTRSIRTVGNITYDETRLFNVNTKIMGWVENLYVDYTGKSVQKGDRLLDIYSPDLVNTEEEYLLALRYRDEMSIAASEEAKKGAEDLVESAKRRLLYWDISPNDIQELEKRRTPKKVMTIYSPTSGIVMEKMVVVGQKIEAGMTLYKIADLSDVWVLADVYQNELPWVKLNESAEIDLSYLPGRTYTGKITYIYPFLNEDTKTVKVRIEVPNPRGEIVLKPDMYTNVNIKSPLGVDAVAVPDQAIIRSGERNIVVVSLGDGYFDPREVTLGVAAGGFVQILDGIREGEQIVTSSQFLIDSESNLKAALSQMEGHEEHEMKKPMKKEQVVPKEQTGHDMKEMEQQKKLNAHKGHTM
jgi:multidrug efflux pump subunit AcrA (membrane-fusion protein)